MMAESNDTGALLLSCGNETEIALGYATLYGDMCGGISVIGDLSKVDVYRLARYVNRRHGREIVPDETFTLKPSAELAANQFDPFDYYVMAPVVSELAERRRGASELLVLFERRALDPARFVAGPRGPKRLRQAHGGKLPRRRPGGQSANAPLGLQTAAGSADPGGQRAGVRLRSARDDHQRLGGLSHGGRRR